MKLVVAVMAAFLVAAPTALAKSEVTARLDTSPPRGAEPGETIRLAWSLVFPDEQGRERPFNAEGIFVRLLSASGAAPTVAYASPGAHPDGRYTAEVAVPEGDIGRVEIGLAGTSCTPDGCRRSDMMFPVDESTAAAAASVPPAEESSRAWLPLASTLAAAAAVLAAWLVARRRPVRGNSWRPL